MNYKMNAHQRADRHREKSETFDIITPEEACFYAAEDAWVSLRLYEIYKNKLENSPAKDVFL